jgi:hypothetical protein
MGISIKGSRPPVPAPDTKAAVPAPAPKPAERPRAQSVGQIETLKWGKAKKADRSHDGQFIGADGKFYAPETPLADIPAIEPNNGKPAKELIVEVNGIMTDATLHAKNAQVLAHSGARVIAIHNATSGMLSDLGQCVLDKLSIGKNPAVDTTTRVIWDALQSGQTIHLAGHSQGALIISRALTDVKNRLMLEQGLSAADAAKVLAKVKVETFGGSAQTFTDGPQYVHWVNRWDLIPMTTGVGATQRHPFSSPGAGAVVHVLDDVHKPHDLPPFAEGLVNLFARTVDRMVHGPSDIYYTDRTE